MPAREGQMRSKLREAIVAGFNSNSLDELLRDNDMLGPNIAPGPDFAAHVNSLIDVARQEGWLVELCGILAVARARNVPIHSTFVNVQNWLMDQSNTNEIDRQFQLASDAQRQTATDGSRFLRLLSGTVAAVVLIGLVIWMFAVKREPSQQPSISTTGPQSPVVQGTKGDVQINFGPSPPASK